MSNSYRLDIQVGSDSAEAALKRLGVVFDELEDSSDQASDSVDKFGKELSKTKKKAQDAGKDMGDLKGKADGLKNAFSALKGVLFTAFALAGVGNVIQTADAMQTLSSQIKIATSSAEGYAHAMSEIERIAMSNMVSLDSVGQLYASNERALKQLGKSQDEVIRFTENITAAMRVGGGSAESQAAAITQLGQAMASGVLRGDEFNSIAEQAPMIMELMADSLGVTTGELRKLAAEGKLTSKVVYDALTSMSATEKLEEKSKQMATTVGGALQNIQTQWGLAVHALMNGEGGLSSIIAGGLNGIAIGLSSFVDVLPAVNDAIAGTVAKAKELTAAFLESDFGQATIQIAKDAFDQLKAAAQGVVDIAGDVKKFFEENPELAIALASGVGAAAGAFLLFKGALILWTGAATLASVAGGVLAATMAVLTSPITLTVVAIGALVAAGVYLYRNWDEIEAKAKEVWNTITEEVSAMVASVQDKWEELKSSVTSKVDELKTQSTAKINELKDNFTNAFNALPAPLQSVLQLFGNMFKTHFNIIKSLVRGDMQGVKDAISQGLQNALQISKKLVGDIANAFKTLGKDLLQAGRDAIQGLINGMGEKIGAAVSKAKEVASSIKNTVTNFLDIRSPSRVMKQIGEWVSEGLAIGIAYKAPLAAKEAKNLAQTVKKALESELESTAANIFKLKETLRGNEFADLTTDIALGKYGKQDTSTLQQYKEEERKLQNMLALENERSKILQDIATHGMTALEKLQWEYDNTSRFFGVAKESFEDYLGLLSQLESAKTGNEFKNTLKDIEKQLALIGDKNPLAEFFYDLEHSSKYAGYTVEQLGELKDAMIELQNAKDTDALKQSSARAFSDLNQEVFGNTPADKLRLEYAEKLTVIDEFEQMHTDRVAEATRLRAEVERQHEQAMRDLRTAQYQEHLSAVSGLMKSIFGEQSKAYRLMFAASKAYALADVGVKMGKAAADAWADPSAVTIWQKLANVAKVSIAQGHLMNLISAIHPKGFRSGGYTGNMGVNQVAGVVHGKEYVLNASATKRIGKDKLDKLNQGGSIGGTVVNVNVTVNSDGTSNVQANSEQGRALGHAFKAGVLEVIMQEKRQGGLLYG